MKKIKDGIKIKKKIILFSSIALFLILSLSIVSKFVLEDFIDYQSNFSKVINISGRQRMLSQRIMLLIQTLNGQKAIDNSNLIKNDLINSIQLMRKSNETLMNGNRVEKIEKITNNELDRIYLGKTNLYQRVNDFTLLAEISTNKNDFNDFLKEYNIYKINSLLLDLDKAVNLYAYECELQSKRIIAVTYIILFSFLFLLALIHLFLFKPLSRSISLQFLEHEDKLYHLMNEKHILDIEVRSAQRALGNLVPRVEFIDKFNTEKIKLASYYQSAIDKGGDWWGIYEFDKTKVVLIGDVTGHEAGSSIIAAAVSRYFEELSNEKSIEKHDFLQIFKHLNDFIQKIGTTNHMEMSMSLLIFNENLDRVKFINAAHSYPYLINYKEAGDTKISRFKSKGHTLGIKHNHFSNNEHEEEIKIMEYELKEDSLICLFSSGLTSNTDKSDKDFGEKNLKKFFEKNNFKNTELLTIVDKLIDEAYSFYEEQPIKDDITFILIKRN
ncbi:SpoIIE family protein phosphatase [Silvanigrella paludirubra]|uniref:SpoIIE family protein phosphatase n=1 Tax=Silvanigrella paludirubra TaxID=2499159 RepID=A0A6N6VUN1_9BACT|nr:SpoIIE family protein phosphatase [Silvanigrella paludirubra]KAB8039459.1 SpoIIE family protein phosphatase [Silvanigrella paludirubra]